jgi:putative membrane protein
MAYDEYDESELALRDRLAVDRTRLANERTLLAYARTAIMLVVAGATALKLFGDSTAVIATGWALILFGLLLAGLGARRFVRVRRRLQHDLKCRNH